MNLLFIGDIFGRPARNAVKQLLPGLITEHQIDFVVANAENASAGIGITKKNYDELISSGIDYFTSGNHIWDKSEIIPYLDDPKTKILRPLNYPPGTPGRGYYKFEFMGQEYILTCLLGRVFINPSVDDPFRAMDELIKANPKARIIADFHAEASSEKYAFFKHFDGKVAAILGTHTHVQTADEQISESGTAYITDVGMVGVFDSIIGASKESIVNSFLTQLPFKIEVPSGEVVFNAVVVKIGNEGNSQKINRLNQILKIN